MKLRITSAIMAVLVLAASLIMPMTGILAGADTQNVLQSWDFSGFENGSYTGDNSVKEFASNDGKVVMGINNAWWQQWKTWTIQDGKMTFTNTLYHSAHNHFVLSFKLDKDLKKDNEYSFETDLVLKELTGNNSPKEFYIYYSPTKDNGNRADAKPTVSGHYIINQNAGGFTSISSEYSFKPTADLAKDGYIHIRFNITAVQSLKVTMSKATLKESASQDGGNQGGETPPPSGDNTETKPNEWNFKGFDDGAYTGDNVVKEFASKDGRVVMGLNNAWWQQWKTWTVQNGSMTFTNTRYGNAHHQFVLSFKLDETLKKDTDYKLETDLVLGKITGANAPKEFYIYYSPTKDNLQRDNAKPTVSGHYIISEIAGGFTSLASEFTFKPTTDLAKDGYITIRFNLTSVDPITLTMSKAAIKEVTSQGGGSGDNEGGEGGNQGGQGGSDDDIILDDSFAGYWDFKGFKDGDYTGDNVVKEYASNDGKVVMGLDNAWWQQWKTFTIKDSVMTFKSQKYSSGHHQFVLSLRLDTDLKAGIPYRLDTDLQMGKITGPNSPKEFYVYYSPTKDNQQRNNAKPTVNGHFIIHETAGGFSTLPATSFEFTPTSDLAKGGYIHIRFNLTSVDPVTVTMKEAWILKLDPNEKNKIVNSGFEMGTRLWDAEENFTVSDDAKDGKNSVNAKDSYYKILSQKIGVEPNKNYELKFWYKGNVPQNSSVWAVSKDKTFTSESVLTRGGVASAEEWTEFKTVFNSGENNSIFVLFKTLPDMDMFIDSISLCETEEAASEFKSAVSPVITMSNPQRTGYSATLVITDKEYNKVVNYSFEDAVSNELNDYSAVSGKTAKIIDDANAFEGAKSLEFTAGEKQEIFSVPMKLEPETEYVFAVFMKAEATKWETDNSKFSNLTFGIADPHTGEFVLHESDKTFATDLNGDVQFLAVSYSGEWQLTGFRFKTDSNGEAVFLAKGRNVKAWFDNFYVFEEQYGREYQSPAQKLEDMEITNEKATMLGITDEKYNLVENSDMSANETFWDNTKSTVLGDTLEVEDSKHNIQKDSFHYESNRKYPLEATYIRWIDLKPNTDYTFSAKLLISKTGNGYFGLAQGHKTEKYTVTDNLVSPTELKLYYFTEENFDYNCNWQNIGFTFNTKNRNRVGIVLSDAGGEAYVDDIKIFETKYAAEVKETADNFPDELVASGEMFEIVDEYMLGISSKIQLSKVFANLENNEYIRAFDASGKEITDLSKYCATGVEIRLMNGPVIKARATVIIKGDINCDGVADNADKQLLLKHLSLEQNIKDKNSLKAADYDEDGSVTVYDLLFNESKPASGTADITFTGPKTFDSGNEIKVTLAVNEAKAKAISGKLRFNSSKSKLKSVTAEIADWEVSYIQGRGEVFFVAAAMSTSLPEKGDVVLTFTFKLGNITSYTDAAVELYEMFAAFEGKLLSATAIWNNDIVPESPQSKPSAQQPTASEQEETVTDSELDSRDDSNSDSQASSKTDAKTESDSQLDNQGDSYSSSNTATVYEDVTTTVEETVEVQNRLSVLKLDEAEISPEFDPEVKNYTATVPFSVEKVTVTAIAESEDATVTIGDTNLEYVGKNKVDITVLSSEGLQRTYRIVVTREAPGKRVITVGGIPTWAIILICVGGALVAAGGTFATIIIIKRKKGQKKA